MPGILIWKSVLERCVGSRGMVRRRKASRRSASSGEIHSQGPLKVEICGLKG